jgi:deoxyinosine 3'endonuclease (endonuclease V)
MMGSLLDQWREEQYDVASKTEVLADDLNELNECPNSVEFSHFSQSVQGKLIGGVDVSFGEGDAAIAVYVITRNHEVVYTDTLLFNITHPYVSSYLAFREIDALQKLVEQQKLNHPKLTPEVILVDGNGILHERKAGLATFLGVKTDIPTIGVGKTVYCTDGLSVNLVERGVASKIADFGKYCIALDASIPFGSSDNGICVVCKDGIDAGITSQTERFDGSDEKCVVQNVQITSRYCSGFAIPLKGESGDILAAALIGHGGKIAGRGKKKQVGTKNPIFISVGHAISLQQALGICTSLCLARIPEPVRQADLIGRAMIKKDKN